MIPGTDIRGRTLLVLSDGKPGHLNQSLAFADLLGLQAAVREVAFAFAGAKGLSYLLDRCGLHSPHLFQVKGALPDCCAVAAAGSATYYAAKVIARQLGVPVAAIMLPRGYRYDFDLILAQAHDRPPQRANILTLPINLCRPRPQGLVAAVPGKTSVALVIGGPSRHFQMDPETLRSQIEAIFALFPGADLLVTSSRRTPAAVEALLETFPFRRRVLYSREPINPIPDFLALSDYVFVTEDSTSMISEAVSFGAARVEVLPLQSTGARNKVGTMVATLAQRGCLHIFDGTLGDCDEKIDLAALLQGVRLCG
ncbi:hypothetical protein JCM30471_11840 [Desulfuromonas carbonis]|uniref:ELM1/GtrOC1 family putative glycosyltransferase n=1 Tax=Desulfuromonas sp. DDH964 TaxID=1823759 RepID=UPI00078B4EB8|nr:ELM1/GtrOC1 family putative glycosyltransferase [Desulfuromonas sp. DDH964]AMV72668.1 hypothetical protein DBW_2331 [Desulfuromonas sp. DDH964]